VFKKNSTEKLINLSTNSTNSMLVDSAEPVKERKNVKIVPQFNVRELPRNYHEITPNINFTTVQPIFTDSITIK
jgi:hypothetical protein